MHLPLSSPQQQRLGSPRRDPLKPPSREQTRQDMASRVAALLLLGLICFEFATAEVVMDCCLSTADKRLFPQIVEKYILQVAGMGCEISATVVITKAGRKLCLVHPDGHPEMQRVLAAVDKRKVK